ncbi:MAG: polysaccharide biosynthesis/export family protein [Gammaproteobacteria bacterium]|nr:polysaccharide biosynthesis/export family protein [Gammaproteobacteria bacterium]
MRLFFMGCLMLGLSGCFIAPGMRMEPAPVNPQSIRASKEIKPIFIPIDVTLVREMNRCKYNPAQTYYIGPYDILNVYVWGHPEFNVVTGVAPSEQGANASLNRTISPTGYLVNAQGKIFFPLIGYVDVEGKTVEQVRTNLIRLLSKYIRQPQLDVRVIGFRSKKIYVMGEVLHPGLQPLTDSPTSLIEAINLAGGMTPESADPTHIFVIRGNYSCPKVYWLNAHSPATLLLAENFKLQPKDVVYIPAAGITLWNRAISQVLPTIQSVWFSYSVIKGTK